MIKIEPFGGGDGAAATAISGGERIGQIIGRHFAKAHFDQSAHHRTHLAMEETARLAPYRNAFADMDHFASIQRFDWAFGLALGIAEGGEVVMAHKARRGDRHGMRIKPSAQAPGAAALQCEIGAAIDDDIFIDALLRREAGMELTVGDDGVQHGDRRGAQMGAQAIAQAIGWEGAVDVDMGGLGAGVHAGISAPSADHFGGLAGHGEHGLFEGGLDAGFTVADALPAGKSGAVIFDGQAIARQNLKRRRGGQIGHGSRTGARALCAERAGGSGKGKSPIGLVHG